MTRNECARWLGSRNRFCILTHARPDGDTIGSATALCLGLRQLGKEAWLLENEEVSPFLARCQVGLTKCAPEEEDVLVCVDVASPGLLQKNAARLVGQIGLRIDHHGSATSFTDMELVDPTSAACGEIIYDVLMDLGVTFTREMAIRLYIAVSTDTGCFRYSNTSANSYRLAAACADTGADLYPITQELFDTTTISELKLENWMVDHARFLCGGRAAVCAIPRELEQSVSREDLEGISGFLRSIEGVKISATIRQTDTGSKMSVRAIPGFDAAAICRQFGGGGHKGAAGASLSIPPEEAIELVAQALEAVFENYKK